MFALRTFRGKHPSQILRRHSGSCRKSPISPYSVKVLCQSEIWWPWRPSVCSELIVMLKKTSFRWLEFCDMAAGNSHRCTHKSMDKVSSNAQVVFKQCWVDLCQENFPTDQTIFFQSSFSFQCWRAKVHCTFKYHSPRWQGRRTEWSSAAVAHLLYGWMTERVGRFLDNLIVLHNLRYFHEIFVMYCA